MLYGASPFESASSEALKPVMRLKSQVFSVRELAAGTAIGYGLHYVTQRPTRVGLVACGYADGYPRTAASGCPLAVDGQLTQLIGRVSMLYRMKVRAGTLLAPIMTGPATRRPYIKRIPTIIKR